MKRISRVAGTAVLLPLLVLAASCGGKRDNETDRTDTETQQGAEISVTELEVGKRVNSAHQVEMASDTFSPGDTLWASVKTENVPGGARILARWVYTEGDSEQIVAEETQTTIDAGSGYTSFFVANPAPWPAGSYEIRVGVDGEIRKTKEFRVQS